MRYRDYIAGSPLSRYTIEECANMPVEEFDRLLEEDNEYVERKYARLQESNEPRPTFNSIEEFMEYYDAIPMEDVVNNAYKMFGFDDSNK